MQFRDGGEQREHCTPGAAYLDYHLGLPTSRARRLPPKFLGEAAHGRNAACARRACLSATVCGRTFRMLKQKKARTQAARTPAGGNGAVEPALQRPTANVAQEVRQAEVAAVEVVHEQKPPVPTASQSAEREKPVISVEKAPPAAGSVGQVPPPFHLL